MKPVDSLRNIRSFIRRLYSALEAPGMHRNISSVDDTGKGGGQLRLRSANRTQ